MEKLARSKFFLPICGLLAGVLNGLLGAGGGIAVVFALGLALPDIDGRDLFANALCVMLPLSAVSALIYAAGGRLSTDGMGLYVIPAIIGGVCGSFLLGRLDPRVTRTVFGALVIYSGLVLMIK